MLEGRIFEIFGSVIRELSVIREKVSISTKTAVKAQNIDVRAMHKCAKQFLPLSAMSAAPAREL